MKTKIFLFLFVVFASNVFSQKVVNEDGSIKYRGNVAIMVSGKYFTYENGVFAQKVNDSDNEATILAASLNALAIQKFQNMAFGVVNRDNDAFDKVKTLLEENKLEDYLGGLSIQAKNQGADFLYVVDFAIYGENDRAAQFFLSSRLLNVENNLGYHYTYKSKPISLNNEESMRDEISKMVKSFSENLDSSLLKIFPEQYFIESAKGKELNLGAYQPIGLIAPEDKFYAFNYTKDNITIKNETAPVQILDLLATAKNPQMKNGKFVVSSNKALQPSESIVLTRNDSQLSFQGPITIAFFGLDNDVTTKQGFIKNRINNAVYSAITQHPGLQIVEQDHLADLKKERELQKSEDFLNGHVVEQMKAIGARNLIHLENFNFDGTRVSFLMSFISVAENRIVKSIEVVSSVDNVENEMYKQICERFTVPCIVKTIDKEKLEILSLWCLPEGTNCILEYVKSITNPVTNEISYQRMDLCKLNVTEYHANKSIVEIKKVIDKKDFTDLDEKSSKGQLSFKIDASDIKSDIDSKSDVERTAKKEERKEKRNKFLNKVGGFFKSNTKVNVTQ